MKTRIYRPMVMVACSVLVFAMAMGQAPSPGSYAANSTFQAKIMDTQRNEVSLTSVTIDGKTTLNVSLGKGRVQIPLENISRIENKDGEICVSIKGSPVKCGLKPSASSKIYGKTSFGIYQIALKDVVWAEFTETAK